MEGELTWGCFVLLYHSFLKEHVRTLVVSIETLTPQGWRLFPETQNSSLPYVWGDGGMPLSSLQVAMPRDTTWTNTRANAPTACKCLKATHRRSSGHKHAEPYPGRSLCPSALLDLLHWVYSSFSTLCSRSPPLRPFPCLHPDQHSPSPLLSADLGVSVECWFREWFIFLSRPGFSGLPELLQGNTSPEKGPLSSQGVAA